jgi:hypothetical protein
MNFLENWQSKTKTQFHNSTSFQKIRKLKQNHGTCHKPQILCKHKLFFLIHEIFCEIQFMYVGCYHMSSFSIQFNLLFTFKFSLLVTLCGLWPHVITYFKFVYIHLWPFVKKYIPLYLKMLSHSYASKFISIYFSLLFIICILTIPIFYVIIDMMRLNWHVF